eukprot:271453-Prorocentrum_minimum.AAC.1
MNGMDTPPRRAGGDSLPATPPPLDEILKRQPRGGNIRISTQGNGIRNQECDASPTSAPPSRQCRDIKKYNKKPKETM